MQPALCLAVQIKSHLPALAEATVLGGLSSPDCAQMRRLLSCVPPDALRPAVSSIHTLRTTVPADRMPVCRANQPKLRPGPCGLLHQLDQCPHCRLCVPGQALCARGVWQAGGMHSGHSAHHFLSMPCPLQHAQCSPLLAYPGVCARSEACRTLGAHCTMCRGVLPVWPLSRCTCLPCRPSQPTPPRPPSTATLCFLPCSTASPPL